MSTNYQQVITASTLIHSGAGTLNGLVLSCSTETASGHLTVYDNISGSGTKIFEVYLDSSDSSQPFVLFFPDRLAPRFSSGCYFSVSGVCVNLWVYGA